MKVLIVDDDQLTAATWAMGLKSAGMDVITASNGRDGINQAKSQKPNMVLLDQIMPDMLGNAVLSQLKSDPETKDIPVMLISNYNENQMMKEAIEKGAVDYILKYQIETKDLVEKVQNLLRDLQNSPQTPSLPQPSPSAPAQPATIEPTQPIQPANPVQPNPIQSEQVQPSQPAADQGQTPPTTETPAHNENSG